MNKLIFSFLLSLAVFYVAVPSIQAQRRDHLNEMEVELVRDNQRIDERMKIFVKAIDRRFFVINSNPDSPAKDITKDSEKWGELPTGTRQELLIDIRQILDEAISKIDDVAARDMSSEYFPIAVHTLADGAKRFQPLLKTELDRAEDEKSKGAILGAIEYCDQIIEASAKVKRESPKEIKKRKEKETKEKEKQSESKKDSE